MDRRHFLTALISGAVLDPEKLLWKPGKLISIPARLSAPGELIIEVTFAGGRYQHFHDGSFTIIWPPLTKYVVRVAS